MILTELIQESGDGGFLRRLAESMLEVLMTAELCCIEVQYLAILPEAQLSTGFVELCKNALPFNPAILPELERLADRLTVPASWAAMVRSGIQSKQMLLQDDSEENAGGVVLEYGHTVGHALELEIECLPHGHAVGLGMLVETSMARARGWLSEAEEMPHVRLLKKCGAPPASPATIHFYSLLEHIRRDNKRSRIPLRDDEHAFMLLKELGNPALTGGLPLVPDHEKDLLRALGKLRDDDFARLGEDAA